MSGANTLDLDSILIEDHLGSQIANYYQRWNDDKREVIERWKEIYAYVNATDTRSTSNASLQWKNTTTIPKLCQIRDNLYANYMATIFPKRKWMQWEGAGADEELKSKKSAIEDYMYYAVDRSEFKSEVEREILDYIDTGNTFCMPVWYDNTQDAEDGTIKTGYVGPGMRRISPYDIVFNPMATSFYKTPKIIREIKSLGEVKEMVTRLNKGEDAQIAEDLWDYIKGIRYHAANYPETDQDKNFKIQIDGYGSYWEYLNSGYVEILTFWGDLYDKEEDKFYRNHRIIVVDRHKVISKAPNPSLLPFAPIFHSGWRKRSDNLWAMGPLDNLVGMQYRIDHLENLKADVFDLIAFPPLLVKGYVEDFDWGPFEKIFAGDDGDVTVLSPDVQALSADVQIAGLMALMEEMAGAPKEAMGFRTPGEKTKYEVQRLENAASRIFQSKIAQFEEEIIEPCLNAMLELARRNMSRTTIRAFDSETQAAIFQDLTAVDVSGAGRLRPVAARHFVEQAQIVQNLTNFANTPLGQDPSINQHISGIAMAKLMEDLLEVRDYKLVTPYIRLTEQAEAARIMQGQQESLMMEQTTPSGLTPDDYDD